LFHLRRPPFHAPSGASARTILEDTAPTDGAGQEISLYFRAAVGTYHSLPLDFLEDSYRHPRLRVTDQAASKAQSLPEPHKPAS
jgi:hypothetical protein